MRENGFVLLEAKEIDGAAKAKWPGFESWWNAKDGGGDEALKPRVVEIGIAAAEEVADG